MYQIQKNITTSSLRILITFRDELQRKFRKIFVERKSHIILKNTPPWGAALPGIKGLDGTQGWQGMLWRI